MTTDPRTAVRNDLAELAPAFRRAVEAALAECQEAGLDAIVFEAMRTKERQAWLYAQGRTRPGAIVTNVEDALRGWHFYGLAVDVISKSRQWSQPQPWWDAVGSIFKRHGCTHGGDWKTPDLPHMQWGKCSPSPREAPTLYAAGGLAAVWRAVGADASAAVLESWPAPALPDVTPHVVGAPAASTPALRLEPIVVPRPEHVERAAKLLGLDPAVVCQGSAAVLVVLRAMAPEGVTKQLVEALDGYRARRCA